jgi:hypothetical protein
LALFEALGLGEMRGGGAVMVVAGVGFVGFEEVAGGFFAVEADLGDFVEDVFFVPGGGASWIEVGLDEVECFAVWEVESDGDGGDGGE